MAGKGAKKRARAKIKAAARQAQAERVDPIKLAADARYAARYPDRAAEEHALRVQQQDVQRDHGHRRNGTAATHAGAAQLRQGALARLHRTGALSADQLGWALEIQAEHERIDGEVGMATMKWGVRVDIGGQSNRAFESLGRVRRAQAYQRWWQGLIDLCRDFIGTRYLIVTKEGATDLPRMTAPAQAAGHVLSMIVDDLGVTWAAKLLRIGVRRMRKLLEDALNLWPKKLGEARDDIGDEDLLRMEARLA